MRHRRKLKQTRAARAARRRYRAKKRTTGRRKPLGVSRRKKVYKRRRNRLDRMMRRRVRVKLKRLRYHRRNRFRTVSKAFLLRHRSRSTPGKVTDRLAVVVRVGKRNVAFYQSTGTGGGSKEGDWVPFNGVSRRGGGWYIKMPGKVPTGELAEAASWVRRHVKKPAVVFDDGNYKNRDDWNRDVNNHIAQHEGLHSPGSDGRGGTIFHEGTVNVGNRSS